LGYEPNELTGCSTPQIHTISEVEDFQNLVTNVMLSYFKNSLIGFATPAAPILPSIPM
jgi:hypothetical protein